MCQELAHKHTFFCGVTLLSCAFWKGFVFVCCPLCYGLHLIDFFFFFFIYELIPHWGSPTLWHRQPQKSIPWHHCNCVTDFRQETRLFNRSYWKLSHFVVRVTKQWQIADWLSPNDSERWDFPNWHMPTAWLVWRARTVSAYLHSLEKVPTEKLEHRWKTYFTWFFLPPL